MPAVWYSRILNQFTCCCRSNPSRGPWKVTLDRDIYQPFIETCGHRMTRWNVWQAFNNRASISQDNMNLSNHKLIDSICLHRCVYCLYTSHYTWCLFTSVDLWWSICLWLYLFLLLLA